MTGYVDTLLYQCCASVVDGGVTMIQNWFNVSDLMGLYLLLQSMNIVLSTFSHNIDITYFFCQNIFSKFV